MRREGQESCLAIRLVRAGLESAIVGESLELFDQECLSRTKRRERYASANHCLDYSCVMLM